MSCCYCSQQGLPADRDGSQTYGERGHGSDSWRFVVALWSGALCDTVSRSSDKGIMVTMRLGFAPEVPSDAVLLDLTVY